MNKEPTYLLIVWSMWWLERARVMTFLSVSPPLLTTAGNKTSQSFHSARRRPALIVLLNN